MLSFTASDHARVATGELTITWRLWKFAHVKAGRDYSTGFGFVHIEDVRTVPVADVTELDALEAHVADAKALVELAASHTGATVTPDTILYRVQFHYLKEPPPKPELSLEEISKKLYRLDKASRRGPWTQETLRLIEENPGDAARFLAEEMGYATQDFKVNVRKLKALGLTISLDTGYELSMLGQTYLDGGNSERGASGSTADE